MSKQLHMKAKKVVIFKHKGRTSRILVEYADEQEIWIEAEEIILRCEL